MPDLSQSGARPDAVLIVDCTACIDPRLRDEEGRQEDGIREWTAPFRIENRDGKDRLVPVNENDLRCPECGTVGRIYVY